MNLEIFNLDFSRIPIVLLTAFSVAINLFIFIYVSLFLTSTRVRAYFSMFVFSLGMWQLTEGMIKLSVTAEGAEQWNRITLIFVLINVLFGFLFSITFTKFEKYFSLNTVFLVLILPILFFVVCCVCKYDEYVVVQSDLWYWVVNPGTNFITHLVYFWITIIDFGSLLILLIHYLKTKKQTNEHRQSLLILIGFGIPAIFGIIFESIFPVVFNLNAIPLTSHSTTLFSLMSLIVIKKYKLSEFSPKHQWEDIVKSMGEGILIVDNNDSIKYANEAFCKLSGYEFYEMEGKNATLLFASDENNREMVQNRIEDRKQHKSSQYELQITTKSGEKKWLLIGGSPFVDKKGKVIGSIGIHANIDDRKIAEQNLLMSNSELEIFVYKASHDLRGPLASIIGLVNVSSYEIKDEVAKEYMKMIGESTKKLDHTLKELVKTMKIKDTARFDDLIDFNKLIEAKLGEFKYFKGFDNINITVNVSVDRDFYSNRFLLETIFQNLIENAIKYQNDAQAKSFLKIDVLSVKNKIQIIFEDNGIGIKSSVQGLIFDMYYKAVESSKGSGLGLYLVKKCVEKLEGEIELKSFVGKGSTFIIILSDNCEI